MFCARLFICALWSPAGKGLTSWLSFVVSSVSLSLSHWYPGSGVVLDCIDSWSLHHYLLLIDTLDFQNKLEIAISDILILQVCFLKVKPKVNKKVRRNKAQFHFLFAFRQIPNTKTWNTQFKIWNTQLSQKEVGKYPIASNSYLELCNLLKFAG